MNEFIVTQWNSVAGERDTIYHLGDFSFASLDVTKDILSRLKGKIVLIKGNHDTLDGKHGKILKDRCERIYDYREIRHNGHHVILFHFPIASWNKAHHGAIHFHGHSHGSYKAPGRIMDVGWDSVGMRLIHIDEAIDIVTKRDIYSPDHHAEHIQK